MRGLRLERLIIGGEIFACDMKAWQGVVDGSRVHITNQIVKVPQCRATFHRVLGTLRDIKRVGGHNTRNDAPNLALLVRHKVRTVFRLHNLRHLPHAVIAPRLSVRLQFRVAMARHFVHIAHNDFGLGEDCTIDALKNDLRLSKGIAVNGKEGIIDVTIAEGLQRNEPPCDVELIYEYCEFHCSFLM